MKGVRRCTFSYLKVKEMQVDAIRTCTLLPILSFVLKSTSVYRVLAVVCGDILLLCGGKKGTFLMCFVTVTIFLDLGDGFDSIGSALIE